MDGLDLFNLEPHLEAFCQTYGDPEQESSPPDQFMSALLGSSKFASTKYISFHNNLSAAMISSGTAKKLISGSLSKRGLTLPNGKILDWSTLKTFADDKINVNEKSKFALGR